MDRILILHSFKKVIIKSYCFLIVTLISSCMAPTEEGMITFKGLENRSTGKTNTPTEEVTFSSAIVNAVTISNDQLILNGTNLSGVTSVQITATGFSHTFTVESVTPVNVTANGTSLITFNLAQTYDLRITDSQGIADFQVVFNLPDNSITAPMLSSMSATAGQVLKYNGTSWAASDLGTLSYSGNWNATTNTPDLSLGGNLGQYYIVTTAGSFDLSGGSGTNSWNIGDWVMWNNVLARWEKINNASSVASFNGRSGPITPEANDYTWAQIDKSSSAINDLSDVTTTGVTTNQILKWNGTSFVPSNDDIGNSTGSVTSDSIANDSIVDADINNSAAIDQSKIANLTTDLAGKLNLSGGTMTGALDMGSQNITNLGTINGINLSTVNTTAATNATAISTNATNITVKENNITSAATTTYYRGDKSFAPLNSVAVVEGSKLYFTVARAKAASVLDSIAGTQTDQAPSVNAVKNYVTARVNSAGDFLANGSIAMTGDLNGGSRAIASAANVVASGSLKLGDDASTCNSGNAGKIKSVDNHMLFCNGTDWMQVQLAPLAASLSASPTSQSNMDLTGGVTPGSYVTFTLTNNGTAPSSTISTAVSNTTNFDKWNDNCDGQTLAIGASCTVDVRPRATSDGAYSGNLTLTAGTTITIALSGTASGFGKLVFATTTTYNGNLGGVAGADSKCQAAATAAGRSGTFKAWVGSSTTTPASTFNQYSGMYYKYVGSVVTKVADSWADLTDGTLDSPIDRRADGTTASGQVWTAINESGSSAYSCHCSNWTASSGSSGCSSPNTTSTSGTWSSYSSVNANCSESKPIWCFEQ